jgi:subtilase family serine protease
LVTSRYAAAIALGGCAVLAIAGVASSAVPAATRVDAARVDAVPASQRLTVQVWLKPDLGGAERLAGAVATPGNPQFHDYLSPDAYTARFGPSAARARAVTAWLTAGGLTQVRANRGRDYVSASGSVSTLQSVFGVHLNRYRTRGANGEPVVTRANDQAVSVPAALAPDVLGVTGLSNAAATRSATPAPAPASAPAPAAAPKPAATCSRYWAQHVHTVKPSYRGFVEASLPVCGYSAGQLRAAYGATWTSTGKGQTVALTEDETPTAMFQTLKNYAKTNHLPAPKPSQFRQIKAGGGGQCDAPSQDAAHTAHAAHAAPYNDEAEMDSEAVYALAPGANQLMVVGSGCDEDQALLNAVVAVLNGTGGRPSASIVSNSWQIPEGQVTPQTVHAIAVRAAAEGVGLYFSSGDTTGPTATASDSFVTAVGGTTLGIGARNNRVFETGWSNEEATLDGGKWTGIGIGSAGGGGATADYPQPAYQKGVVPASMSRVKDGTRVVIGRAGPDIAADADLNTGMLTGYTDSGHYRTQVNAGTSLACPLIAALVADAQQGRWSNFGFINPLLYRLAGTPAVRDVLPVNPSAPQQNRAAYTPADDTFSPSIDIFGSQNRAYTDQVLAKGYDTMTGIGTPNGPAFITGLRRSGR